MRALVPAQLSLWHFRAEANGLWRAASVDHAFGDTYMTTIELEAPETGKKQVRRDGRVLVDIRTELGRCLREPMVTTPLSRPEVTPSTL